MRLTCNQLILLMDIRRGFNEKAHTGTLSSDIKLLKRYGLIEDDDEPDSFQYRLTEDGDEVCTRILIAATGDVMFMRKDGRS